MKKITTELEKVTLGLLLNKKKILVIWSLLWKYIHSQFPKRVMLSSVVYMCNALEICQKYIIIHRYIKPNNIFVAGSEEFQIGDFSLVRTLKNFLKFNVWSYFRY